MSRLFFILLVYVFVSMGCALPGQLLALAISPTPTLTATPTRTPLPPPTSTPRPPTPTPQVIVIQEGGFSMAVPASLQFTADNRSISLSDDKAALIVSLNGRDYIESEYTLETFLTTYIKEMEGRGGNFTLRAPYEITVDGIKGLAIDLTGTFLGASIAGQAIAISPSKNFIFFGLGLSNLESNKFLWERSGHLIFEALLESVKFKAEIRQ